MTPTAASVSLLDLTLSAEAARVAKDEGEPLVVERTTLEGELLEVAPDVMAGDDGEHGGRERVSHQLESAAGRCRRRKGASSCSRHRPGRELGDRSR